MTVPSIHFSIGWELEKFSSFFIPFQIISVALRFYARWLVVGAKFALDDILVFIALILQLILSAVQIACLHDLRAVNIDDSSRPDVIWGKHMMGIMAIYFVNVVIPKLGILVFYKRLFPLRTAQYIIYITGATLICSAVVDTILWLAECSPFARNFNPDIPGRCLEAQFLVWISIPNIVTDCIMLLLPLPIIWKLPNPTRIKVGLTFTFLFGSLGLVVSVLRFWGWYTIIFLSFDGSLPNIIHSLILTTIEPGIYLVSACLVTYRPLIERIGKCRQLTIFTKYGRSESENQVGSLHNPARAFKQRNRSTPLKKLGRNNLELTEIMTSELSMNTTQCTTEIEHRCSLQPRENSQHATRSISTV